MQECRHGGRVIPSDPKCYTRTGCVPALNAYSFIFGMDNFEWQRV